MVWMRKERIWPTIIVAALAGNVLLGIVLARVAGADTHFAVEPDYYRKAIGWDATMVQERRNIALGWQLRPSLGAVTPGASTMLGVDLRARDGAPITDALVLVEAMPVAYAREATRVELPAAGAAGNYAAAIAISQSGLWELRITASRGRERFTANLRLEASRTHSAGVITVRPGDPPS